MKSKPVILGPALPNIPWENKPAGCTDVVWRSKNNPVIPRNLMPWTNSIFNSAVIPFHQGFKGVFRVENRAKFSALYAGKSPDGLKWKIEDWPIQFTKSPYGKDRAAWGYDPRVTLIEGRYYITWCNDFHGPTIGLAYTDDFQKFYQLDNIYIPYNRNGVLFPKKIDGHFVCLSRPSDNRHTEFGDIFLSQSRDLEYWGRHQFVMGVRGSWQGLKIGAGPIPIETAEGWLMIYHGVYLSCNGMSYSMGAAILDIDKPWKVKYRTAPYLLSPQQLYECVGDVPNVVFPVATLQDAPTGRIAIYYGAADTCTCLAFCQADELIAYIKANSRV
jgi:beta-1,4-mannooligosaccharide/beta-1,4-mannosyl-N-acetylglucosamine phosphorylase